MKAAPEIPALLLAQFSTGRRTQLASVAIALPVTEQPLKVEKDIQMQMHIRNLNTIKQNSKYKNIPIYKK